MKTEELRDECTGGTVPPVYRRDTPVEPSPRYTLSQNGEKKKPLNGALRGIVKS